MANKS
ncbi:hypothetical protein YPPY06_4343, partial [Yersinia pestis PY-06]